MNTRFRESFAEDLSALTDAKLLRRIRRVTWYVTFHLRRASWIESQGLLFPNVIPLIFAAFWVVVHCASYGKT